MKHIRCNDITKALLALTAFLFFSTQGRAQFTIKENFMGSSVGGDIILGGTGTGNQNAYLTSGNNYDSGDPDQPGLAAPHRGQQRTGPGYAYIDKSFPSTLGVVH
ncbi:MAG: hypothetical protein LKE68_02920 [Prevotella sp.]|jgi:hypothetical protein|nr:hypothetical protein [Prevotella sp.]MCH3991571.1 hypothetical protein [Prevotella sp.]